MRRLGVGTVALALTFGGLSVSQGAAPATPSYFGVERTIDEIRKNWEKPEAPADANAPGWKTFFDALLNELHAYSAAKTDDERLLSLDQLYKMAGGLNGVHWAPASRVRTELRDWLRPRVRLAWAERRLIEAVHALPPSTQAEQQNRKRWIDFVDNELAVALRNYDGAKTVGQRADALKQVQSALKSLQEINRRRAWVPSSDLQTALSDLYDQPNVDLTADLESLRPEIEQNLITNGPVKRKQYISQLTAGPKTGWGLIRFDEGIAFYNRQKYTSVTPVWDFNKQIESDPQGQQATRLYSFRATTTDHAELTMVAVLRPTGLQLEPSYTHNADMAIAASPTSGNNLARIIAGFIGADQQSIEKRIHDGAVDKMRKNIESEALEQGREKAGEAAAEQNRKLAKNLIGNNRLAINNVLVTNLRMRSRPTYAQVSGILGWRYGGEPFGADAPQPPAFSILGPGMTADVHLGSVLNNVARGYLNGETARPIENLVIVTKPAAENAPPGAGATITRNVDYAKYLETVAEAKTANDPKVVAIRVKKPATAPEFAADAHGNLVVLIHDLQIDVPAPSAQPQPGEKPAAPAQPAPPRLLPPAKVFRITAPRAEVIVALKVAPATATEPVHVTGRVESFDPGAGAKVYAIDEDESKARPLTAFVTNAAFLPFMRLRLRGTPIDVPIRSLPMEGIALQSASPLDPSGWIRINLVRIESEASRQAKKKSEQAVAKGEEAVAK